MDARLDTQRARRARRDRPAGPAEGSEVSGTAAAWRFEPVHSGQCDGGHAARPAERASAGLCACETRVAVLARAEMRASVRRFSRGGGVNMARTAAIRARPYSRRWKKLMAL